MRIFKDGIEIASRSKSGAIDTNPSVAAAIGNQPQGAGSRPFDGLIDDVRIYHRALSAAEINGIANSTNQTPVASFTATPVSGPVPLLVSFDAAPSTDPDGVIVSWAWDFDGDGSFDETTSTATAGFTYTTSGTYDVVLQVTDNEGETNTAIVPVTSINDPPSISGSPDTIVYPGAPYSFVPDAGDPEGGALTLSVSAQPGWTAFDTATGELSGVAAEADIGVYEAIRIAVSDGEFTVPMQAFEISVVALRDMAVTLSWSPPTSYTDDSLLVDLSGYKVCYWDENVYPNVSGALVIDIDNPGLSAFPLDLPWAGFWKFAITACNAESLESELSGIVPIVAR